MEIQRHEHSVSLDTIFQLIVIGLTIFLLWKLKEILLLILLSLMLASALYPVTRFLNRWFSQVVSSLIVILILILPLVLISSTVVPSFVTEFPKLMSSLNTIIHSPNTPPPLNSIDLSQYIKNFQDYVLHSTSTITGLLASYLTIVFLTLYFMIDFASHSQVILDLFPKYKRHRAEQFIRDITNINGQYIRGNLVISVICGTVTVIGLMLLHVPHAIPLAIFTAVTDILPVFGATIGALPAIIIGFSVSPVTGILVLLLYIVYQQTENNVLIPHIYNKALDLSPSLSIVAVLVGGALFGAIGAFIALPIAASIPTIVKYISDEITTDDAE